MICNDYIYLISGKEHAVKPRKIWLFALKCDQSMIF